VLPTSRGGYLWVDTRAGLLPTPVRPIRFGRDRQGVRVALKDSARALSALVPTAPVQLRAPAAADVQTQVVV